MPVTEPLFQLDAYLRSCTATAVEAAADGVVLDRSVFYPLGGGQPGDSGALRAADGRTWRVLDARKGEGGRILHVLEPGAVPPEPGTAVEAAIDWERRHAHMRMHTSLHLLGSVLRFGVRAGKSPTRRAGSISTRRRRSTRRRSRPRSTRSSGPTQLIFTCGHGQTTSQTSVGLGSVTVTGR